MVRGCSLRAQESQHLVDGLDDRYAERAQGPGDARDGVQRAVALLLRNIRLGPEGGQRVVEGLGACLRYLAAQLLDQGEEFAQRLLDGRGGSGAGVTRLSMPTLPEPPCRVTWSPLPK